MKLSGRKKGAGLFIVAMTATILFAVDAKAQNYSLSTNVLGWATLGTVNAEAGMPVSKNFTVHLQGEYNPFHYDLGGRRRQFKHLKVSAGTKYWPWFVHSGWFISGYADWFKYSTGGVFNKKSYEGNAWGVTIGGGYALILGKGLNLEMGLGAFAGVTDYTRFACIVCGEIEKKKKKVIVTPDNVLIQLTFLF